MAENSLTSEQINQIYQSACDQNLEEFKKIVIGIDPSIYKMAWSFYRAIAFISNLRRNSVQSR
jgi:hypothetical protein